jgi:hypothetical protein
MLIGRYNFGENYQIRNGPIREVSRRSFLAELRAQTICKL